MTEIGGYFGLAERGTGRFPHSDGVLLNTGRNALEYLLRSERKVSRIFIPFYTCDVILQPIRALGIPYDFYHIDENLEIHGDIELPDDGIIIVNNYFGLKDSYIRTIAERYHDRLIADCSQAFFSEPVPGVKSFYSCRKFVGVSDGGVAYPVVNDGRGEALVNGEDDSSEHDSHLFLRSKYGAEAGFLAFRENESKLDNQPVKSMSRQTLDILNHFDYDKAAMRRRANLEVLDAKLSERNRLPISMEGTPMVYPLWIERGEEIRGRLISNRVFCARYWPNVLEWCRPCDVEYDLANNLVAVPCDQRYCAEDMERIIEIINN